MYHGFILSQLINSFLRTFSPGFSFLLSASLLLFLATVGSQLCVPLTSTIAKLNILMAKLISISIMDSVLESCLLFRSLAYL